MEDQAPRPTSDAPAPGGGRSWDSSGPVRIALVLVGAVVIVLPLMMGLPSLSAVGVAVMVIVGRRGMMRDEDGGTRIANHAIYFAALCATAYAIFGLQLPSVIAVYFASIVLLNAAHLAGAKAAILWAVPFIGLVTVGLLWAPETERAVSPWVTLGVRIATVVAIVGFGVAFRRAYDRQSEELLRLATTDSLTGLANRATLARALDDALGRAVRHERVGAVIYIDLDGLKLVNDREGHEAGDQMIRTAAKRLQSITRATDTAARLGGDEFVLLLSEISEPNAAEAVAHKLHVALTSPFTLHGRLVQPRASLGVALFPRSADTASELLRIADDAMYQAKRAGGNGIRVHDGEQFRDLSAEAVAADR